MYQHSDGLSETFNVSSSNFEHGKNVVETWKGRLYCRGGCQLFKYCISSNKSWQMKNQKSSYYIVP
jgi:hypothetical protein